MKEADTAAPPPTVFVVDDEDGMRHALKRALAAGGFNVHDFASGPDFLAGYRPQPNACLLLDMKMPGMSGLELQAILNERRIALPVIFLTGAADVPAAVTAMKAGAADFLEKPFDNEVLLERIRQVLAHRQPQAGDDGYRRAQALLTPRENEVLQLMLTGMTSKLIARELGVSHRTVEIHRGRVMEKMQTKTLAELVRRELSARTSPS